MSPHNAPSLCVAVLAAGQSRRFGEADKLAQPLNGTMLGIHICDALAALGSSHSLVVTASQNHPCASGWRGKGFEVIVNEHAEQGLGTSVARAASFASKVDADTLLICLADMPFVPSEHLQCLVDSYDPTDERSVIASTNGETRSPPALFGAQHFEELTRLDGDVGARGLLALAHPVPIAAQLLADIDTRAQLDQANAPG